MERKKFRYLPHVADVAFVAYGNDLRAAIQNAAGALLNVMLDLKKIRSSAGVTKKVLIRESADSLENLVWYVLQDILTRVDEKKLRAHEFKVDSLSLGRRFRISGSLYYKEMKRDPFLLEVKAVTPHGLAVEKDKEGYSVKVLLDV